MRLPGSASVLRLLASVAGSVETVGEVGNTREVDSSDGVRVGKILVSKLGHSTLRKYSLIYVVKGECHSGVSSIA